MNLPAPDVSGAMPHGSSGQSKAQVVPSRSAVLAAELALPAHSGRPSSPRASSCSAIGRSETSKAARAPVRGSSVSRIGNSVAKTTPSFPSIARSFQKPRRAEGGKFFQVECLPADHSCGFHGLGISREEAASALRKQRNDEEVQEFVAADLAAAVQTGDRKTFPREIREDEELWGALKTYYAAQQTLDQSRRQAHDLLTEEAASRGDSQTNSSSSQAAFLAERYGLDVSEAMQRLCCEMKARVLNEPSGPSKVKLMQRLGLCHAQVKAIETACQDNKLAQQALQRRCRARFDTYVAWVGTDRSFWLSFVRGCGNERTGGLLDALAKVRGVTVCIWAEKLQNVGVSDEPELEMVHEASFGTKTIHLWYQGDRGHFDRLLPYKSRSSSRSERGGT